MPNIMPPKTADIWYIPLSSAELSLEAFLSVLSRDEQARAERYHHEPARRDFILTRGGLRMILARYLPQQPEHLEIVYGGYGKPYLQQYGMQLAFNLSHTQGWGVCLVHDHPVGVDIEQYKERLPAMALAKRFFVAKEFELLQQQTTPTDCFYQLWTCKEAVLKAQGMHLSYLAEIELDLTDGKPRILSLPRSFDYWVVYQWRFHRYYCAAALSHVIYNWRQYVLD